MKAVCVVVFLLFLLSENFCKLDLDKFLDKRLSKLTFVQIGLLVLRKLELDK